MGGIAYSMQNPANGTRRYASRNRVFLRAQNEASQDQSPSIIIRNLSKTGCLIETLEPLSTGDEIKVSLADGRSFTAIVVWADQLEAGCSFKKSLSRADYAAALLASDPQRPEALMIANYAAGVEQELAGLTDYPRWPRPVRVAVLAGLSIAFWATVTWATVTSLIL